ncbi:hypothetical protein DYB32_010360 [Aphanomyces invadans]|uniref:Tafazzin family protein n=1 Tax=Aphanomyces invadans TaxID=157072 RepID=A0A3R6WE45_9STRA|nr:hypothetical protein DYB32_010360 [Aphanomyces invadans]
MAVRRVLRVAGVGASAAIAVGTAALYIDAPVADKDDDTFLQHRANHTRDRFPAYVSAAARSVLFYPATLVSKVYLGMMNDFTCRNEETLEKWVLSRPDHRALITVTNHSATVDDPAVLAAMLPWSCARPSLSRWSICSQEYCYAKGPLLSTIFFGTKTLPIKRGAGIDHPFLEDLFKRVQDGDWVHIFPEGKIVQGGRDGPEATTIGRLKWGVGKLIARAEITPVVLPIYHVGMDKVCAIHRETLQTALFGDGFTWESGAAEKKLYSAITRRIELALLALEKKCYIDMAAIDSARANTTTLMT